MEQFIAMLLSIFVFVAIVAFSKWRDLSQERKLRNLVAWSVAQEKPNELLVYAHDLPLWAYLKNAQIKHLSQEHCISGDNEWKFAKEILAEYQKDLTQNYFKGYLKLMKSKYVMRGEEYFMFRLYVFLSNHECDYEFLGYNMHKEMVERNGNCGEPHNATYSLTEFAIVLHKMHYITYMYCRENDILRDFIPEWNEKIIKEILDTKLIQILWI